MIQDFYTMEQLNVCHSMWISGWIRLGNVFLFILAFSVVLVSDWLPCLDTHTNTFWKLDHLQLMCHKCSFSTDKLVTVNRYRVASIISGQMAVTQCTHTGTQLTTMTTLWLESVCTWMWAEAGGELTVKLHYQEPCVTFPHQVSATSVKHENVITHHCVLSVVSFLLFVFKCLKHKQQFLHLCKTWS